MTLLRSIYEKVRPPKETDPYKKAEKLITKLDKMDVIAYTDIDNIDDILYVAYAHPFPDVKLKDFSIETSDAEEFFTEIEIYYERAKTQQRKETRNNVFTAIVWTWLYVWNVITFGLAILFVFLVWQFLKRAGLTDEIMQEAYTIFNLVKADIISWIP